MYIFSNFFVKENYLYNPETRLLLEKRNLN